MADETTRRPLCRSLGEFAVKDLDRLNEASELLAAAAQALDRLSSPAGLPIRELVYQANTRVVAVMAKPVAKFKRWHDRGEEKAIEADNAPGSTEAA